MAFLKALTNSSYLARADSVSLFDWMQMVGFCFHNSCQQVYRESMNKLDWGYRAREELNESGRTERRPENTHLLLPFAVCLTSLSTATAQSGRGTPFQELEGRRAATGSMEIYIILFPHSHVKTFPVPSDFSPCITLLFLLTFKNDQC